MSGPQTQPTVLHHNKAPTIWRISLSADVLTCGCAAVDLDQPDMLGWSQGGIIALQIAANYSAAINRLVLADTAVSGADPTLRSRKVKAHGL